VNSEGEIPERSNGTDCKSVASATKVRILLSPHWLARLRSFLPGFAFVYILVRRACGSSSVGRAIAFQAIGREFEPRLPLKSRCSSVGRVRPW